MRCRLLGFLFLALISRVTYAQSVDAFVNELTKELVAREVSAVHTGTTNLSTAAASGTNRDYASPLLAAFESFAKSKGESIAFESNFDIGASHGGKVQFVFKKPDISTQLQQKLASNAAALDALRGELTHEDDITVTLSVSPAANKGEKQARIAFRSYATPFLTNAYTALQAGKTSGNPALQALLPTLAVPSVQDVNVAMLKNALMVVLEPVAEKIAEVEEQRSKFTFDGTYHSRHETVGPDDLSFKVRYELGFVPSVIEVMQAKEQQGAAKTSGCAAKIRSLTVADVCGADILAALNTAAEDPNAKKHDRVVFALEVKSQQSNDVVIPQYEVDLKGKRAHSIIGSITGGRDIGVQNSVDKRGRIDVELKYEEVTDDPLRNDRFVGSVTYTQRVSETLHIPISLIYANHADYLTNVDRRLNAHFGISYKLP